jgi:hypothetical protein
MSKPFAHTYKLSTIQLAIEMVLFSHTSFRGVMHSFNLFGRYHSVETPSWVTIENWVLRFGLHQLQKKKEKRDDWIFILDHTVQSGTQKGLVILGIPLAQLNEAGYNLSHQDTQVLKIIIDNHSTGEMIAQYLQDLSEEVGVPIQIISDHGSDIKKGIELFCEKHETVCYTYDITHDIGLLLKKLLEHNEKWKAFSAWCSQVRKKALQTNLGFLAPPVQKTKARYLNLSSLIRWANNILNYEAKENFKLIDPSCLLDQNTLMSLIPEEFMTEELLSIVDKTYDNSEDFLAAIEDKIDPERRVDIQEILLNSVDIGQQRFNKYFSGIHEFKNEIAEYIEFINVIHLVEKQVKNKGLSNQSVHEFKDNLNALKVKGVMSNQLTQSIIEYLENEGEAIPEGQNWLCTSDIIESIFGKYKLFSSKTKLQGISKLILAIPVFVADITIDEVKGSLESIRSIDVKEWIDDNLGQSLLSKRMEAFQ